MVRRYSVLLMFALWMGGFTFYTLIVIPTGGKVLDGGERDVGFITQQVTVWLNWLGVAALPVFGWNALAEGAGIRRWLLLTCWLGMALTEAGLFILHPILDGMLDTEIHAVHGGSVFFDWHRRYMAVASLQWLAALGYMWMALLIWRATDKQNSQSPVSIPATAPVTSQYKTG
jgi:hypothetical protein